MFIACNHTTQHNTILSELKMDWNADCGQLSLERQKKKLQKGIKRNAYLIWI